MKRLLIRVYGIVQGVGFRPFVSRIADAAEISGSVCNKGPYVEIFAQGTEDQVRAFLFGLENDAPARSAILKIETEQIPPIDGECEFKIIESEKKKGDIFVSPDIAICKKCEEELFDPNDRRYLHPFINCTACGPRLTILDSMPYDRARTSMGEFPMCPECGYEYTHPETRRFHAQPVCCNDCGPELYLANDVTVRGTDALLKTRDVVRNGGIAAIKGIGGFHLCCDATNQSAVERLRALKPRPMKPFAVMARDLRTAERECEISDEEKVVLDGHQKPIILLRKKNDGNGKICGAVAPQNPKLGIMLPYAPVQLLLFSYPDGEEMTDCFVMTSGNVSGAPICRTDDDAVKELSRMCDIILSNNRTIRLRADDSVMAFYCGKPYMVRRSRGYAPLPFISSKKRKGALLAVGGELKNCFCLAKNDLYYPSPYIGDLADLRSVNALKSAVARMEELLETTPEAVACDLHPGYNSSAFARGLGIPVIEVQHHYAHIASCLAENDFHDEVIGVSFDGTGYGTDGTIWGGEFLRADLKGFERLGSAEPFRQAGGDLSSEQGWRIAVSMLLDALGTKEAVAEANEKLKLCDEKTLKTQFLMLEKNINCVKSTSVGRLFDAASAILGIRNESTFEGEAATALEFAAEKAGMRNAEAKDIPPIKTEISENGGIFAVKTANIVKTLYEGRISGKDINELALYFHDALANAIAAGCGRCREITGLNAAALSGGVFQNMLLTDKCKKLLEARGFKVLLHSLVPPNDGGIALGQAAHAMELLEETKTKQTKQSKK